MLVLFICMAPLSRAQSGSGWQWAVTTGTALGSPGKGIADIATDASGNVYVTGRYTGTLTLGSTTVTSSGSGSNQDAYIAKFNPSGSNMWLKSFGNAGNLEFGQVIAVDASANVYIGGSGISIGTSNSAFLNKYDTNGNLVWSKVDFPLYEVGGISLASDGNLIVMESYQTSKNIYKINSVNAATIWSVANTNAGSNAGSVYHDFIDNAGNIYYTCFTSSATTAILAGESVATSGLASFIVSLDQNGNKRWVQTISNIQVSIGYGADADGNSYIVFAGGSGGTFQGYTTSSTGNRYFELNSSGTATKASLLCPYLTGTNKMFRLKGSYVYGFSLQQGSTAARTMAFGDYFYTIPATPTFALGLVVKYNKATQAAIWANSFEITGTAYNSGDFNCIETTSGGKVVTGGDYGTTIKTGNNTYTASNPATYATDLFISQFDESNVAPPAATTWTGNANNGLWSDANNWNNGVPNGSMLTNILPGPSNYPSNIGSSVTPGKLTIGAGVTLQLPLSLNAPGGVVNNGTVELNESGIFYGGFNSGSTLISGTGKVVIKNSGITYYGAKVLNNSLEINATGNPSFLGATVNGSVFFTNGILNGSGSTLIIADSGAVVTYTTNSYLVGNLKCAVKSSGTYVFPTSSSTSVAVQPVTLTLNNTSNLQNITVSFTKTINGSAPNTTAGGQAVTQLLNAGFWTITPDVALSSGSYTVKLQGAGFTNSVTDASRYVVLKRTNSSSAWAFFGNNGTATQTSTVVSATAGNITGFSDFTIGIASASVAVTLPVRYISFTAEKTGGNVLLKWETANELNNAYFNIQHSINRNEWVTVGKQVSQAANGYGYTFTHNKPISGTNYYRLQQVDKDGRSSISEVRAVDFTNKAPYLHIYPTPLTGNTLYVEANMASNSKVDYVIVDMNGKVVQSGTISTSRSMLSLNNISKGHYILRTTDGQTATIEKL